MILVKLMFEHYAPKDSITGTQEYLLAKDEDQAVSYIDKEYMYDKLADFDLSEIENYFPTEIYWENNPGQKQKAIDLGLEIDEHGYISGNKFALTKWLRGTKWEEPDDSYYGFTQWDWSDIREISENEAEVLLQLGMVKDIRS